LHEARTAEIPPLYGRYVFYVSGISADIKLLDRWNFRNNKPIKCYICGNSAAIWPLYLLRPRNFRCSEIAGSAELLRQRKFRYIKCILLQRRKFRPNFAAV